MLTSRDDHFHQFVPSQRIPVIKEFAERCNSCIILFLCLTDLGLCFFDLCIQCFHRNIDRNMIISDGYEDYL